MQKEENSKLKINKNLYKIGLYSLKIIQIIIGIICFINTILFYFNIDLIELSFFGGISFLSSFQLLWFSYIFKLCLYHRLPLYYTIFINLLSYIDIKWNIPISQSNLITLLISITTIFMFLIIYLKMKHEYILKKLCFKIT
jgi:hypothetical protein